MKVDFSDTLSWLRGAGHGSFLQHTMMADTAKVVDLINNAKQMVTEAVDR